MRFFGSCAGRGGAQHPSRRADLDPLDSTAVLVSDDPFRASTFNYTEYAFRKNTKHGRSAGVRDPYKTVILAHGLYKYII